MTGHHATPLIATDLDRTMIFSRAAMTPADEVSALVCVEHYHGRELSFVLARSVPLLHSLAAAAVLVPVTTRTLSQYRRVKLPLPVPRFAVAANGAILLENGQPDQDWTDAARQLIQETAAPFDEVWQLLESTMGDRAGARLRQVDDLFMYAVSATGTPLSSLVTELTAAAEPLGWTVSHQGRKVYVVPKNLTKAAAVQEVARRAGASTVYAAGDSLLDAGMLATADAGIQPCDGELARSGWQAAHVAVTRDGGAHAGEQILQYLLDQAAESYEQPA